MNTNESLAAAASSIRAEVDAYLATNPRDGGTCNFDSAYVMLARGQRVATQKLGYEALGFSVIDTEKYGRKCLLLEYRSARFQGQPRTEIARIISAGLRKAGVDSSVHYQTD